MTRPLPVTYEWSTLAGVTRCSRSRLHWGRIQWAVACVIYSGPVSWVSRLAFWASIGSSRIYHLPAIARAVVLSLTDPVSCDSAPGVGLQLRVSRTQNGKSHRVMVALELAPALSARMLVRAYICISREPAAWGQLMALCHAKQKAPAH